ncbi:MAG TPA: carboxypeptidase-like regulatory domain-containing protein [Gaiellaceae bacterium]|nr:carboxypeptidase-like regulatory domain-containing protein [Gaiellaceae bacterium]
MNSKRRSSSVRLLLGAGVVILALVVTWLALSLRPDEEPSGVTGTVIAWPCNPVESQNDPPCPGYVGEIRVLREDGSVVTTSQTDAEGRFRVELPPGVYVVDPNDGGKSLANGDGRVTVREGSFARVDLTHYTGLL